MTDAPAPRMEQPTDPPTCPRCGQLPRHAWSLGVARAATCDCPPAAPAPRDAAGETAEAFGLWPLERRLAHWAPCARSDERFLSARLMEEAATEIAALRARCEAAEEALTNALSSYRAAEERAAAMEAAVNAKIADVMPCCRDDAGLCRVHHLGLGCGMNAALESILAAARAGAGGDTTEGA